jgi:hypothetical protein
MKPVHLASLTGQENWSAIHAGTASVSAGIELASGFVAEVRRLDELVIVGSL